MKRILAFAVLMGFAALAAAQSYPSRVVKIVGPYPAGTGPDNVGTGEVARDAREAGMQPE